ncbi:hypothetical protein BGZ46_007275 [Entomortierella lignicola]|nr:hypothetical protein BGZ46_007275 [Entomortierella lignicola]
MAQAVDYSYKKSESSVKVDDHFNTKVPRDSVYDTELMRILTDWLGTTEQYQIVGQWRLRELENHKYSDIVIKKDRDPTVVLELLATWSRSFIQSHIGETPFCKEQLGLFTSLVKTIISMTHIGNPIKN